MGIIKSLLYKNFHTSGQEQYVYIGMISRAWRGKKKLALLNIFNGPKNGFPEWKNEGCSYRQKSKEQNIHEVTSFFV